MNKTEHHKKAIIDALEKSLGVVTTACKNVGIGRTTFYEWMKDDQEFEQEVNEIQNMALDFVCTWNKDYFGVNASIYSTYLERNSNTKCNKEENSYRTFLKTNVSLRKQPFLKTNN